jgi:acyl carrier protein
MTRDEILDGIAQVARAHVGFDGALTEPMRLQEDLGLDSIRLLVLAAEVENRFQVALEPADDAAVRTVGDLVDVVARKLGR